MYYTVVEFSQLRAVPAVGGSYEITCDTLQLVYCMAAAYRAFLKIVLGILISTCHAAIAVVVDRAITDIVFVHHVNNIADSIGIMSGVTVDFDIEYVAAACQGMIGSLDFSLVTWRAVVVHRHMVGICMMSAVSHSGDDAERLAVFLRELAREPFGRSSQH